MCGENAICSLFSENCAVGKVSFLPTVMSVCCIKGYDFAGKNTQILQLNIFSYSVENKERGKIQIHTRGRKV